MKRVHEHNFTYSALIFGSMCETKGIKFEDYEDLETPFHNFYLSWYNNDKGLSIGSEEYQYFSAYLKTYLTQEAFNEVC